MNTSGGVTVFGVKCKKKSVLLVPLKEVVVVASVRPVKPKLQLVQFVKIHLITTRWRLQRKWTETLDSIFFFFLFFLKFGFESEQFKVYILK